MTQTDHVEESATATTPPATPAPRRMSPLRVTSDRQTGWVRTPQDAFSEKALLHRLIGPLQSWRDFPPSLRLWFWLGPVLTAVLGGVLRFVRLGEPRSLVFDETYYVKDAYSLLQSGYERNWEKNANTLFNQGDPSAILNTPEYVVHPPLGKWMIAWGMDLFGVANTFGWRFSAAVVGTLSIFLVALIAQKLFGSVTLGIIAGLLTAIDGTQLVMSRTSILDIFLMFWVVVAFGCLVMDRFDGRRRLARRVAALPKDPETGATTAASLLWGPWLGWRWWRFAAAVAMGAAAGVKLSGLFFLAAFGLMLVFWDISARRTAGIRHWFLAGVLKDGLPAFLQYTITAGAVYVATWTGWFLSKDGYNRQWAEQNPGQGIQWLPAPLRSLWQYHVQTFTFHEGLTSDHPYKANAWTWLVLGRPTSFYYESPKCPPGMGEKCSAAITSLGNPFIWWGAVIALVVVLFCWVGRRDWRAGAILAGMAGGYLPWFMYPERTTFFFYTVAFEPFMVLALTFVLGMVLGSRRDPVWRRRAGLAAVAFFVAATVLVSAFFFPIWTGQVIPYNDWHLRMWMPSWI